jgi:hypothetical protein
MYRILLSFIRELDLPDDGELKIVLAHPTG